MNDFQVKTQSLQEEIAKLERQYMHVQALAAENAIEQSKIVEQNITIKNRTEELAKYQAEVSAKENILNEREKQIVIKEKSIIASNKILDERLLDFRTKLLELTNAQNKLQKDLEEYKINKAQVDRQTEVYKRLEETEGYRKNKLKLKEEEVDKELARLKGLSI